MLRKIGPLLAVAAIAFLLYSTYHHSTPRTCIVTLAAGKLCNGDAAAWCRLSDSIRSDLPQNASVVNAETTCSELESEYSN